MATEDQLRVLKEGGPEVVHHHTALYRPHGPGVAEQHLYVHYVHARRLS
ncbi:hypothetical protein [Streptomyces inhibens]|nr:hypothetical protein [Streptomyces inhibens]UKY47488.1 hypothetical protein KI385_00575 [Streptomyces inhibens]